MFKCNNRLLLTTIFVCLLAYPSGPGSAATDPLTDADAFFNQGGLENIGKAIELYQRALVYNPNNYDANWKCARAYRTYGDTVIKQQKDGWKKECAKYGTKGIEFAEKAIEIDPKQPEGYYYYGLSVGTYADGVSILTALAEGLKKKTQTGFEKAYEMDKMYNKAGPILALGRFWSVLPWPLKNKEKALAYYREYQQTEYFATTEKAKIYLAELLLAMKGEELRSEAIDLLEQASTAESQFYSNWANKLLEENK